MSKKHLKITSPENHCRSKLLAFSMAEAVITLSVLGVIAAISIPSIINKTTDTRRVKLKKAVEVYSNAIVTMSSENNFHGSTDKMDNWGSRDNCANVRSYFKIVDGNGCQFKTSDGVWWSVGPDKDGKLSGRLSKALVAFKESDLTKAKAIDEETNDAFYLMTQFDNKQKARILDVAYANYIGHNVNILNNAKVYAFINKKEMQDYMVYCNGGEKKSCIHNQCYIVNGKNKCQSEFYDYNGIWVGYRNECNTYALRCPSASLPHTSYPELNVDEWGRAAKGSTCDKQGDNCSTYLSYYSADWDSTNLRNSVKEYVSKLKDDEGNTLELGNFILNYDNCSLDAKGPDDCKIGPIYIAEYMKADGTFWQIRYTEIPNSKEKIKNPYNIGKSGHLKDGENVVRFYDYYNCTNGTDVSTCKTCVPVKKDCP